jgi:mutator protein MutT
MDHNKPPNSSPVDTSLPVPLDTESTPSPIPIGIGLIQREGRFLIRQRPAGTVYEGYWEFPGGKCEPGESPEQATARECLEEVGQAVLVDRLRHVTEYLYPHGFVRLHFFDCRLSQPDAEPASESGFIWVNALDLASLRFPEANETLLEKLVRGTR